MSSADPLSFLMTVSPKLLQKYAKGHEIELRSKTKEETSEEYIDALIESLAKESETKQGNFNTNLEEINSVSTNKGCEHLLSKVMEEGRAFDAEAYSELSNMKERAMYFYLHYYDLFCETRELYDLEKKQGWRGRKTEAIPIESVRENLPNLKRALQKLYAKECRGRKLKIKQIPKKERTTYIVYVEDISTNDLAFKGDDLESDKPRRPVFTVCYRYFPKEGIIEVRAEGGKSRIKHLQGLFIEYFLKADPSKYERAVRYDFEKVRNLDALTFPTEAKDNVESVTLKGLRIVHNERIMTLAIDIAHDQNRRGVKPMQERLKAMGVDLKEYEVRKFKILILFKQIEGQGRQEKRTVAVTYPSICDLKDSEIDIKVRKLLKKWELDLF